MNRLERRDESFCQETLGSVPKEDLLGPNTGGEGEVRGSGYTGNGENKVQIGDHERGHRFWGLDSGGRGSQKTRQCVWRGSRELPFFFFHFQAYFLQLTLKKGGELNHWVASQVLHSPQAPFGLFL